MWLVGLGVSLTATNSTAIAATTNAAAATPDTAAAAATAASPATAAAAAAATAAAVQQQQVCPDRCSAKSISWFSSPATHLHYYLVHLPAFLLCKVKAD